MKKRIISGAVMGIISILVIVLGLKIETLIITTVIAIVAAIGVLEMITNVAKIENVLFKIIPALYTVIMVFLFNNINEYTQRLFCTDYNNAYVLLESLIASIIATVVYAIACAVLILVYQEEFTLSKIAVLCGTPTLYAYAFSAIVSIVITSGGVYYLLLLLNFSCICDMGAYFVGVTLGKTKLCPEISPNKTVEGALGGIAASVLASLIITLCFGHFGKIIPVLLLTIPVCAVGMVGDLFASIIKRKVGIKDYGNIIPGHGGILDRVDSALLVAPLLYCLIMLGVI